MTITNPILQYLLTITLQALIIMVTPTQDIDKSQQQQLQQDIDKQQQQQQQASSGNVQL